MPRNVTTQLADGRQTQVMDRLFTVVYGDAEKEKKTVSFIKQHGGFCTSNWNRRSQKLHYIVLDLPRCCTMIDVPFDEPTIAFSQENMARQFGVLHKDGRKVYPDDDTPILVTKEWLKVAVHTYIKAREIE